LQFPKVATANMTDSSRCEYDWRRRLSHVNMTESDLTKYDWRRRLGDGGFGDYPRPPSLKPLNSINTEPCY